MFSDIYKTREMAGGLCLEEKMVSRQRAALLTRSWEGDAKDLEGDGTESTAITRAYIVMNPYMRGNSFTKEAYKKCIKDYEKAIKGTLEEQRPERVRPFMMAAAEQIKHIPANFKNHQVCIGENMIPEGMNHCEDGVTPYMISFWDRLEMEKC